MKREDMGKVAEDQNVKDERFGWYFLNASILLFIIVKLWG